MADATLNVLLSGSSGRIGTDFVLKMINGRTYQCKYPDMTNIIPSAKQRAVRDNFGAKAKKSKQLADNPEQQLTNPIPIDRSLFHTLFKASLSEPVEEPEKQPIEAFIHKKEKHPLNPAQQAALNLLQKYNCITNAAYRQLTNVSKATATRHLQQLVAKGYLVISGQKGAVITYTLPHVTPEPLPPA